MPHRQAGSLSYANLIVITRLKAKKYTVARLVSRFFQLTQHLQTR